MTSNFSNYREWRAAKLDGYPARVDELLVPVNSMTDPGDKAVSAIRAHCARANMAIYVCQDDSVDRAAIRAFAARFGLQNTDHHPCADPNGVSELTDSPEGERARYAPYSRRGLSWHTDGYYNESPRLVRAFLLHCVQKAAAGGRSAVLDPEIAYIRLRDENPDYITAFEHPACMTIPANVENGVETRPEITGPVFSYGQSGRDLHMRYSARKINVRWRDDPLTTAARQCLAELLHDEQGPVLSFDLQPRQGIISNNVLHNRSAYEDGPGQKRLLYRARFYERIEQG